MKLVALVMSASCWGCGVSEPSNTGTADDAALDTIALQSAAIWSQLPQVNAHPYGSSIGAFNINVMVAGDLADYRRIHPETTGSGVTVPPGTVIVRAVLNSSGSVTKLTLMAKGPPGYDPSIGDWWWGVTDPAGTPLVDDAGAPQLGRLTACHSCHLPRATDDFLFGVPAGN